MALAAKLLSVISLAAALAAAAIVERPPYVLQCQQVRRAMDDLTNAIDTDVETDEDGKSYRRLIGGFVRLSFHKCAGGKCKGCINVNDPNNVNIAQYVSVLESLYQRHPAFSRGDFWALAGIAALLYSEKMTNAKQGRNFTFMQQGLAFRYGRVDCSPTSPYTDVLNEFPNPLAGIDETLGFFARNFNFSAREATVILGAHKLGGTRDLATHKIFRQWVSTADTLTNEYYTNLMNDSHGFTQAAFTLCPGCPGLYAFQNYLGKRIMLNADMSIRKNLTFYGSNDGRASCTVQSCPNSSTMPAVVDFAASDARWQSEFADAFMRMIETGYGTGELQVIPGCRILSSGNRAPN